MAITMNEKSMNEELDKLLQESEKDISRTWATIQFATPKLYTYALQNKPANIGTSTIYCYVGISVNNIKIVTLHALDVTRVSAAFCIPLADFQHISIKNNALKCSATFDFGNEKIKLSWVNAALGTDMKQQRKQVHYLYEYLSTRNIKQ